MNLIIICPSYLLFETSFRAELPLFHTLEFQRVFFSYFRIKEIVIVMRNLIII